MYDKGCAGGTRAAISFPKYAHIALCPAWFEAGKHGLNLPVHVDCPTLRANNTLENAKYPLLRNQYAVFIEEMLQLYLEGGNFEVEHSEDVYPTHEFVGLNATASLRNVQNWAIYAACKCYRIFSGKIGLYADIHQLFKRPARTGQRCHH